MDANNGDQKGSAFVWQWVENLGSLACRQWSLMRKLLHERLEWPDTYATSITRHTTLA